MWTVHNLRPHDLDRRASLALLRVGLGFTVGGYIHLSSASAPILSKIITRSKQSLQAVIPIGRYSGEFFPSEPRETTRARHEIFGENPLVVFVGQVARYKGVLDLAQVVHASTNKELRLIIAGRCADRDYAQEIECIASADSRIQFNDERLGSTGFANLMQAADVVAYPYTSILNSASVLPPLETRTRVLAPRIGAIPEMSKTVGEDWIITYEQPLTGSAIDEALRTASLKGSPDLTALEWPKIGIDTKAFYLAVMNYQGENQA
ncbi:glycosyltransferase [Cryobacterium gelidum]|uniref:glycosyltransferase n=1 Tax=Cryobacterium gelidum TaxID=1259164 RepID=UPI00141A72EA|nr:glycosyltransferase [Cryobacterium gelidum]